MESSFPSTQSFQTPPSWWGMSKEDPKSEAFRRGKKLIDQRKFARKASIWKYQFEAPFSLGGEPDKVALVLCVCLPHVQSILFPDPETWCISLSTTTKGRQRLQEFSSQTYECLSTLVIVILQFSFYYINHTLYVKRIVVVTPWKWISTWEKIIDRSKLKYFL